MLRLFTLVQMTHGLERAKMENEINTEDLSTVYGALKMLQKSGDVIIVTVDSEDYILSDLPNGLLSPEDVQNLQLMLEATQNQQPITPTVPQQVSMRQARLALLNRELLDDVEAVIAAAGRQAQIEWEYAATVDRNHAIIAIVQQQQGLTDSDIDELFINAAAIP